MMWKGHLGCFEVARLSVRLECLLSCRTIFNLSVLVLSYSVTGIETNESLVINDQSLNFKT